MSYQVRQPFAQFFGLDGKPLEGGFIYFGEVNKNPQTDPIQVYSDDALTQPLAQPLRTTGGYVSLNGKPIQVFAADAAMSVSCYDSNMSLVFHLAEAAGGESLLQFAEDLANDTDPAKGAALVGYRGQTLNVFLDKTFPAEKFGIIGDGVADAAATIQAAIDAISLAGGGQLLLHPGNFRLADDGFLNVKQGVVLLGSGAATRIFSESGGALANYTMVYLKDLSGIHDLRLSGSDYMGSRNLTTGEPWNKIGITTQGAATGRGIRISGIGFEKCAFSLTYIFDNHRDVEISGCYSFGQQVGVYADLGAEGVVENWNADGTDGLTATKIANGTRVYALTNFHNSGSGTADIRIHGNTLTNINDSLVAPNAGATDHHIYDNRFEKTAEGYFGGYGIDFNGCSSCKAWGNTVIGASYGAYFHDGATNNRAFGNTFRTAHGVGQSAASGNSACDNDIVLSKFGTGGRGFGPGAGVLSFTSSTRLTASDNSIRPASINTALTSMAVTGCESSGAPNRVRITVPAHGLVNRAIVEVSGVTGTTEANGVWQVLYVDANKLDLIGATFANAYISGGTCAFSRSGVGMAVTSDSGASRIRSRDNYFNDLAIGMLTGASGVISDNGAEFVNTPIPRRGVGVLTNNQIETSGLSSSGVPAKNLGGTATILASTTTTLVTFQNEEPDTNYKVLLSNSLQDLGVYWTNKTTVGFTINHTSPGFGRTADWFIFR